MQSFLDFFEFMPVWMKFLWIVGVLSICWILEGYYAFNTLKYKKWKHAGTNFILLAFVMVINIGFGVITLGLFEWAQEKQIGLLFLVDWPIWVELIIALLILDLIAQYGVHYLLHKVKWMWKLHLVHHSDTKVDATTGTRHHPFDFIIRETFALFAVLIAGMPLAFYLFYRIVTIFFTYFTHANIKLPGKLDQVLSYIFVTPAMHKFHHHHQMPWTDTNFGNMFSIWDRLFGTFVYEDTASITYGLDLTDPEKDENIWYQLSLPFNKKIKYKN